MPRRPHTLRASQVSSARQQGRGCPSTSGNRRRVTPTTSYPCSFRRAAAREESTPPLMATITLFPIAKSLAQTPHPAKPLKTGKRKVDQCTVCFMSPGLRSWVLKGRKREAPQTGGFSLGPSYLPALATAQAPVGGCRRRSYSGGPGLGPGFRQAQHQHPVADQIIIVADPGSHVTAQPFAIGQPFMGGDGRGGGGGRGWGGDGGGGRRRCGGRGWRRGGSSCRSKGGNRGRSRCRIGWHIRYRCHRESNPVRGKDSGSPRVHFRPGIVAPRGKTATVNISHIAYRQNIGVAVAITIAITRC